MFAEVKAIKLPRDSEEIALNEIDKKKLEALIKALSELKLLKKSTYASCARHFDIGKGMGSDIKF